MARFDVRSGSLAFARPDEDAAQTADRAHARERVRTSLIRYSDFDRDPPEIVEFAEG
jgi:hypothetical protein